MQNKVTINATKQCEFKRVRCCSLECQCSVQLYSVLGCTQTLQTPAGRIATVWVRVVTAGSWAEAAPAALCSLHHPNPQYCSADTNTCIRQQNTFSLDIMRVFKHYPLTKNGYCNGRCVIYPKKDILSLEHFHAFR